MHLDKSEFQFTWRKADELGVHENAIQQCLCISLTTQY